VLGALTLAVIEHVLNFHVNQIQGDGLKGNTEVEDLRVGGPKINGDLSLASLQLSTTTGVQKSRTL
jgi:hypothetical protein